MNAVLPPPRSVLSSVTATVLPRSSSSLVSFKFYGYSACNS